MHKIEDIYDGSMSGSYFYIFPLERVSVANREKIGNVTLFPAGQVDIRSMFSNTYSLLSEENEKLDNYIELFESNTLVIINGESYSDYPGTVSSNREIINKAISKCSIINDYIKFKYCSLVNPRTMPARLGQISTGDTLLLMYNGIGSPFTRVIESTVYFNTVTAGKGLEVGNPIFTDFSLLNAEVKEVGHIAKQALRMYASALEENDDTGKFIEVMRLFEFVASPSGYTRFQEVRTKIASHIVKNGADIQRLQDEFKYFSSGDNEDGLRTEIIHNGKSIESLVPNDNERTDLFVKLQSYMVTCINDLVQYYDKTWNQLEDIRISKMEKAKKNKEKIRKISYSHTAIIIDGNFIDKYINMYIPIYREIHPDKTFDTLNVENVMYEIVRNCRKLEDKKTYKVIFFSNGIDHLPNIKIPIGALGNRPLKINDCFFDFEVHKFDAYNEKISKVSEVTSDLCIDNPFDVSGKENYQNIIFVGDSPEYIELLNEIIKKGNRDLTIVKSYHHSEMSHRVPYFDVGLLVGVSFGLTASEL
ncbi:hypothetical protein [Photobacterium leiognathi]|uniref:hypothetical protein n=1 Tax=Photobacterium leiognathi TaxID=553611 RepID=UPI00298112B5|nr:hypothetical protein [Photobacterium leiognathi]